MSARRLPSTSTPITPVSGISDFLATSTNLPITQYYNGHLTWGFGDTVRHPDRPWFPERRGRYEPRRSSPDRAKNSVRRAKLARPRHDFFSSAESTGRWLTDHIRTNEQPFGSTDCI